ncbi:DNA helicase/exodeoxyribonuclease V, gamma subunit [Marinospirillum celere]|uniref:RecBCD enzyme subunit RecC n=1 Tax=Marinospirillum celere TaxID=1122252 RepID=A0A1I1ERY0_9GAMM|nr:exodeoxyribonuclease V subunit gamma [Marinospirillum celere]SFB87670.1 DNA helicase/exodeoxyribonuclease V, gamma subunit [Marinospirillum celere]
MTPPVSEPLTPGLMILQGNQLEELRDLMVQWLSRNPLSPLEDECILVQSNGIAQWLKMAMAADPTDGGCGIAASMQVQLPGRFIWKAYRSLFPELPEASPFDKQPLTWRLYQLLAKLDVIKQQLPNSERLKPLEDFLNQDSDPRRLHQLAANLADLFDQYQVYRADWLEAWEAGQDILINARGQQQPLEAEAAWQPLVWRLLLDVIDKDQQLGQGQWDKASRASIHQAVITASKQFSADKRPAQLPRRVVVFGISSLPRQTLELLEALAPFTQILLFVSNPCQHYWGDLIEGKDLLKQEYRRIQARKLPSGLQQEELHLYGHPLLASWGKQGRDYLHLLDASDQPESYQQHFTSINLFTSPGQDCLLHQLQDDLLELRSLQERQALESTIDPEKDLSLSFQIAHSPQREIEILQDQLLQEFERAHQAGKPLQPRDLLVMVPDINDYAAAIQAVFGRISRQDPRYLPYQIADQGQRGQNTLLIALEKLLHLPASRFSVSELLDLLDIPSLRENLGLKEADLPRLRQWIEGANIRWGLDGQQRASLDLPASEHNTWMQGLKRMLLGYANGSSGDWQGIQPYAEVAGLEAELVGPLVLLLDQLEATRQELSQPQLPEHWLQLIQTLLNDFFVETSPADTWALTQVQNQLETLETHWRLGDLSQQPLPLEVVREELLSGIDQPNLTQKFLGGSINFATLMPMRAIPFRQIWLLGMNDQDYPRSVHPAHYDLMAKDYRPGDRSRREDDRYLFLEALLSAREKLVISWVGRDIRDNSARPPSVLVSQLRDHLAAGWSSSQGEDLLSGLTCEHPLQAFSRNYFLQNRDPRLFTYAHEWRVIHQENSPDSEQLPDFQSEGRISLQELSAFLRYPVRSFYQQRLGVYWQEDAQPTLDDEPFQVQSLDRWALQKQLLDQVTQDLAEKRFLSLQECLEEHAQALQRAGYLPLPPFHESARNQVLEGLQEPLETYQQLLAEFNQLLPAQHQSWQLSPHLELEASLQDLRTNGQGQTLRLLLQPSRLHAGDSYKWHHLIRLWPGHLFAQLHQPVTTRILGPATDLSLHPLHPKVAERLLLTLAESWQQGMQEPLPLPCRTGFAWLMEKGQPQTTYEGGFMTTGESQEHPAFKRFWPEYYQLEARGLAHWCETLYRPLVEHLEKPTS